MTQEFLRVLLYLFQNYMLAELMTADDVNPLLIELRQAGFANKASLEALDWLYGIKDVEEAIEYGQHEQHQDAQRVFCAAEIEKISADARGLIMHLEQRRLIDATTRELIIDRAMDLETTPISLIEIRCIANMVILRDRIEDPNLLLLSEWLINDKETIH